MGERKRTIFHQRFIIQNSHPNSIPDDNPMKRKTQLDATLGFILDTHPMLNPIIVEVKVPVKIISDLPVTIESIFSKKKKKKMSRKRWNLS